MSKEEWLLDSITKFLRSPGWALPVMQFIDDNCVVFDDDEENKLAYSDIYAAFREMVESLLEMHLEDMGVTPEQFAGTVGRLSHTKAGQETLQQILAVDDYLSFKKMMAKRNRELELEALKALEELSAQAGTDAEDEDEAMLQRAIKESMLESGIAVLPVEIEAKELEREEAELRMAIALSIQLEEERAAAAPPPEPEVEPASALPPRPEELQQRMEKAASSMKQSEARSEAILPLKRVQEAQARVEARVAAARMEAARVEATHGAATPSTLSSLAGLPSLKGAPTLQEVKATEAMARAAEVRVRAEEEKEGRRQAAVTLVRGEGAVASIQREEMEARAAHLRKQRDLILAQRKRERENAAAGAEAAAPARPAAMLEADPPSGAASVDSRKAGLSRALAAGLKAQLSGTDDLGLQATLDARKQDLAKTKDALRAEFAAGM